MSSRRALSHVRQERARQEVLFPDQHLPSGTSVAWTSHADRLRQVANYNASKGTLTWAHVLQEEFFEAMAEEDDAALRAELVQVAAVAVRWIEDIDGRTA